MMNITIKQKLIFLVAIIFVLFSVLQIYVLDKQSVQLKDDRKMMVKSIVETGYHLVDGFYQEAKAGKMSHEEAKKRSLEALDKVLYDKKNNYIFVYQYDGVCLNTPVKRSLVGKNLIGLKDKNDVYLIRDLIEAGKKGGGYVEYVWTAGTKVDAPKISYAMGNNEWQWMIGSGIYVDDMEVVNAKLRNAILIFFFSILAIALVMAFLIIRSVIGRITAIRNVMTDIAEGEGDLTVKLPADSEDELGVLAQKFNIFIGKLHRMISDISEQTQVLSAASEELQLTSANMSESLHNVSDEIRDTDQISQEVNGKTLSTAAAVEQASQNIENIASMSREIQGYYENLQGNSSHLKDKVMSVTAAVEEMNATIGEITKNTTEAAAISQKANQKAEDTGETMIQLSEMANDINEIVDMIKEVSAQTNLLALNATIEAASAGEAGKGFAVVANEIKNLANQTAEATKKINEQISAVQKHTEDSVGRIREIQEVITSLNEINISIATALEEQSVTIGAISGDMTITASTTRDTVENVHNVGGRITEVTGNIDQATGNIGLIARDTQEISSNMEGITGKVSEVNNITIDNLAGAEEVNQSASELAKMAEHLNQIVSMFKL